MGQICLLDNLFHIPVRRDPISDLFHSQRWIREKRSTDSNWKFICVLRFTNQLFSLLTTSATLQQARSASKLMFSSSHLKLSIRNICSKASSNEYQIKLIFSFLHFSETHRENHLYDSCVQFGCVIRTNLSQIFTLRGWSESHL
jgi:hypothetical protein